MVCRGWILATGAAWFQAGVGGHRRAGGIGAGHAGGVEGKREELEEALRGLMGPHQRFMLAIQLSTAWTGRSRPDLEVGRRVDRWRRWTPSRGSDGAPPRSSWRRLSRFPSAGHLLPGPGCVQGTTGARRSISALPPRKATTGSRRLWWRRPGPQPHQDLSVSPGASGPTGRPWRLPTAVILHQVIKTGKPFADLGQMAYFHSNDGRCLRCHNRLGASKGLWIPTAVRMTGGVSVTVTVLAHRKGSGSPLR